IHALTGAGFQVAHATSLAEAKVHLRKYEPHLAIVDVHLPDGSGFDLLPAFQLFGIPVIFATVVSDEGSVVRALDDGAIDYVTKPFRLQELLARVRRALALNSSNQSELVAGDIRIDLSSGRVFCSDSASNTETQLALTPVEFQLLTMLVRNYQSVCSRKQLTDAISNYTSEYLETNTLNVYFSRLRQKLGNALVIETVRGQGYRAI
ncbi:MAG: response regulator transcription factor, partial [Promicromonosporaceae bacterium]|nr:response regulator transcription factor [Promicromonosporaceae bacterium]